MKTQIIRRMASFVGIALLTVGLLFGQATPVEAYASVLYVAPGSGCGGMLPCFPTVQLAVAAANPTGVEIRVAAGTYTDMHDCPRNDVLTSGTVKAVVCVSKAVTIRGGYNTSFTIHDPATYVTTLNAQSHGRVLYITGAITPTVADLSLTGGNAAGLGGFSDFGPSPSGYDAGAGVYIMTANATLTNNHIFSNTTPGSGGGVFIGSSNSQLSSNTINNNTVLSGGGGGAGVLLHKSGGTTLTGNKILNNTSGNIAGGVYLLDSDSMLVNNTISSNTATVNAGGVEIASCDPSLTGNIITSNSGAWGGGVVLWYSNSVLTNNVIINNQATTTGSGLWIGGSHPQLLQNTISHNTGGDGSGIFATIASSAGSYSVVTMKNAIVANQAVGIKADTGSTVSLDGVLWYNNSAANTSASGVTVTHAYTGNTLFAADGYHLTAGSAAINKGVNAGVTTDVDGRPRLNPPDLGADEFILRSVYLPLSSR